MKKFAFLSVLAFTLFTTLPALADDTTAEQTHPSKKVSAEVSATLAFTACVAKLLNSGLAAQEARQLCIDSVTN